MPGHNDERCRHIMDDLLRLAQQSDREAANAQQACGRLRHELRDAYTERDEARGREAVAATLADAYLAAVRVLLGESAYEVYCQLIADGVAPVPAAEMARDLLN